ncbi:FimV/HubP family polar landmark protein [Sphaerotilus sp.]|jgi:FimV-like protein|uniref:FimV/HubP family polar landmark protein n=1 Tax=Sphaerotilus sp. TaxID=2093942 RepID=UPI0025EC79DA|nr:FimV/HubP family polar landmark protein [Sphaerotilus sp.]
MLRPPLKRHLLPLALALSAGPVLAQTSSAGAPAPTQRTTVEQDNLWDIAGQLAPAMGATRQQVMVAVLRRNPDAFVKGNIHRLRRGVPLVLPGQSEVLAEDRAGSVALVADHLKALRGGAVLTPLVPRAATETPAPPVAPSPPPPPPAPVAPPPAPASVPTPVEKPASAVEPAAPVASAAPPIPAEPVASAPVAVAAASEVASAAVGGGSASRVLPWLLGLGALTGGVILWRRRRAGFQPDGPAPDFTNTLSATRTGGPRVFDISNAAAEMARSVETSQAATQLVRSNASAGADVGDEVDVSRLAEQAAIKLDIARASLELGRTDSARALLLAVVREGSGRHAAEAAEILARMG